MNILNTYLNECASDHIRVGVWCQVRGEDAAGQRAVGAGGRHAGGMRGRIGAVAHHQAALVVPHHVAAGHSSAC